MLNDSQQRVVQHENGPALVIAGAGTGKTRVLVHRTAHLVERGVPSQRILLLSFTRRSAEELRHRIKKLASVGSLPWCGTFHSVGARLLRIYGNAVGVPASFSIIDQGDSQELFGRLLRERFTAEQRKEMPSKSVLAAIVSYCANTGQTPRDVLASRWTRWADREEAVEDLLGRYTEAKSGACCLDYDDLLRKWYELWHIEPRAVPPLFDHVMVDEYQDTNAVQADILRELANDTGNIMAVGDDAQAVYGFRGATVRNILGFAEMFPDATPFRLEHNYRSTQPVLDAANALIAEAEIGFEKVLESHRGSGGKPRFLQPHDDWREAEEIISAVCALQRGESIPLGEQAVLVRSSFHAFRLEILLNREGIAYRKVGGLRFADSAHIKDAMAFLRCAENPRDESAWQRVLGLLPGVGAMTANRLFNRLMGAKSLSVGLEEMTFPKKTVEAELDTPLRSLLCILCGHDPGAPGEQLARINAFCAERLPERYDNWEERKQDLDVLAEIAGRYESRRELLDDVAVGDDSIVRRRSNRDAHGPDTLTVSTIHGAKGCEWDAVLIPHLIEGGLPVTAALKSREQYTERIEEERRLLYVAMTRARRHLFLLAPDSRRGRGSNPYPERCEHSRFLTQRLLATCEGHEHLLAARANEEDSQDLPQPPDEPIYDYTAF